MKFLFFLIPNNSGSTFIWKSFAAHPVVGAPDIEGQYMPGFRGPSPAQMGYGALWTLRDVLFRDEHFYDWNHNRDLWGQAALKDNPDAQLLAIKSPPDICRLDMLQKHFPMADYVLSVRNPYAMVEGILRQNPRATPFSAASHTLNCLHYQMNNRERLSQRGVFFSYEELTGNPGTIATRVTEWRPELDGITFSTARQIKGKYSSTAHNYNKEQLERLDEMQIDIINSVFRTAPYLMEYFGYEYMG